MTVLGFDGMIVVAVALALGTIAAVGAFALRRRRVARAIGDPAVLRLLDLDLLAAQRSRYLLVCGASVAIAGALIVARLDSVEVRSRGPVVLVLDASASMLAADVEPTRLEAERAAARELVAALPDLEIGIVPFAGRAYTLAPPTRDHGALSMYIDALDPSIISRGGSALGPAIRQAIGLLSDPEGPREGTIVVFSDGGAMGDPTAALEAASLARDAGLVVETIGIGTSSGAPVPVRDPVNGSIDGLLEGPGSTPLISRLDDGLLRAVADRGGGGYESLPTLTALQQVVAAIAGTPSAADVDRAGLPRHAWFALIAILALLVEPISAVTRRPG